MLVELRAAVSGHLHGAALGVEVWPSVPEDVTALPCVVVGYPEAAPARETAVFDRSITVYVLGRRVDAGDPDGELVALTDQVVAALGGTSGTSTGGQRIAFARVEHRTVTVAGVDHDGYVVTLESPYADC